MQPNPHMSLGQIWSPPGFLVSFGYLAPVVFFHCSMDTGHLAVPQTLQAYISLRASVLVWDPLHSALKD